MSHSHTHDHHHDHDHGGLFHTHAPAGKMKQAFFLAMIILVAEVVFGLLSNSLALLADAWHMATDVLAIGLAWFALVQGKKPANHNMTFGYERAGILAAAVNGLTLVIITIWILYSAVLRIMNPEPVHGMGMFIGAGIGLIVNLIILFALNGDSENLNVRATLLHVIGDVGASLGVIVAGILIYFTRIQLIDPFLSILIALIVAYSAWTIIRQSFGILMEATPKGIVLEDLVRAIKTISGIQGVHDMHVWTLTGDRHFLTCHAVLEEGISLNESPKILDGIHSALKQKGIDHATIQLEDCTSTHHDHLICDDHLHDHHDQQN